MFLNNKGITMVESLIALVLTAIAIVALMPMQDNALKTMSRSDNLGRAEGIMQTELESQENALMNSTGTVTTGVVKNNVAVYASGLTTQISGDARFYIYTTITQIGTGNSWTVYVKVWWTGNTTGIHNSIVASRL
jgi:Tfp pilus assembly protein PilV